MLKLKRDQQLVLDYQQSPLPLSLDDRREAEFQR
jgi:hypothetical protein